MSYSPNSNFWVNMARGFYPEYNEIHQFGVHAAIGTTYTPICYSGIYQTPTTATALEIISSSAADTAAGAGARTVTIEGLDSNWDYISQTVSMNGLAAVAIPTSLTRVTRASVATSGTYATAAAGSHVGDLTIRVAGGGATWAIISVTGFARGSTTIGAYSVPTGKSAIVYPHYLSVESTKAGDVIFFYRSDIDTVAAPYSPMIEQFELVGAIGFSSLLDNATPLGPFVGPCDIGFMGRVSVGTGAIAIDFEILEYTT